MAVRLYDIDNQTLCASAMGFQNKNSGIKISLFPCINLRKHDLHEKYLSSTKPTRV